MAGCYTFDAAAFQTEEIINQAYQSRDRYNAEKKGSSSHWSDYYMTGAKAAAKASAETFTFPVRVCDKDGANIAHGSCFALYSYQSGLLATSRYVADAQRSGPQGSQVLVKINGEWLLCELDGVHNAWGGFISGFSSAKGKTAKIHLAEGSMLRRNMFEFGVTASSKESWTGSPVLDTTGHVIGVITGKKGGMTLATTAEHLIYYSMALGLKLPAYPGGDCSGEDVEYL